MYFSESGEEPLYEEDEGSSHRFTTIKLKECF